MIESAAPAVGPHVLARVLLALLVVVLAARGLGLLFRRLHQPSVIGEVVAGILLGPSLLGALAPRVAGFVFPPEVQPSLELLAQLGVVLFMFLVGVELDGDVLRRRTRAVMTISHASMAVPFLLGGALAPVLYPRVSSPDVPFASFALFFGVAMSITAFPVLARILRDHGLDRTPLGVLALGCAAVCDVVAWCLLAMVVGIVRGQAGVGAVALVLVLAYGAVMWLFARPAVHRLSERYEREEARGAVPFLLVGLLASALATETIGIHAIFGAFLLGVFVPHGSRLAADLAERLEDLVLVLLLPAFFAVTGLRTELGLLQTAEQWWSFLAILAVACLGKIGGTLAPARAAGLDWRDATTLGVLMNTRGLMELVVLSVGLELGLVSRALFAMMVLMAVATTLATGPLLDLLWPRRRRAALVSPPVPR